MKLGENNYIPHEVSIFLQVSQGLGKNCGFFTWALRFQNRLRIGTPRNEIPNYAHDHVQSSGASTKLSLKNSLKTS